MIYITTLYLGALAWIPGALANDFWIAMMSNGMENGMGGMMMMLCMIGIVVGILLIILLVLLIIYMIRKLKRS